MTGFGLRKPRHRPVIGRSIQSRISSCWVWVKETRSRRCSAVAARRRQTDVSSGILAARVNGHKGSIGLVIVKMEQSEVVQAGGDIGIKNRQPSCQSSGFRPSEIVAAPDSGGAEP